jgi:hypothetical protein
LQSLAPVLDGNHFIASLLQHFLQKTPRKGVIVGNEDPRCVMFWSRPRSQAHAGLQRLSRCPLSASEAMKTGRISAGCRDLPADCRLSRRVPCSLRSKRCADLAFARFAKSIAIARWILLVLVFKVVSQNVQ